MATSCTGRAFVHRRQSDPFEILLPIEVDIPEFKPEFHFRGRFDVKMPLAATYFSFGACADPKPSKVRLVADLLGVPFEDTARAFADLYNKLPLVPWKQAESAFLAEAQAAWPMPTWPPVFRGHVALWCLALTLLILLAVMV